MSPDAKALERDLVSKVRLTRVEARVFLLLTVHGSMNADEIASRLGISRGEARESADALERLGAFINLGSKFEAMHPRFTAVNMYRRTCERDGIEFSRNDAVDRLGAALEGAYDSARTKYD